MSQLYTNNALSTLASGYTAADTTITVQSGDGAKFPASDFTVAIGNPVAFYLRCTSRSTDVLTVDTTGQEGTSASNKAIGTAVSHVITAAVLDDLLADMVGDSGSGGIHGLVPAPGSGDTAANKFLKADASWATPPVATGAVPYLSAKFTGPDSTRTITGATHGYTTPALFVMVYDDSSPRNAMEVGWTVDSSTFDVVITFASAQSDYYVVIMGATGPQGSTPAGTVIGTAIFSATGGSISNTYYSGCVSSVSYVSTGKYTVNLSPSQIHFTAFFTGSDDNSRPMTGYFSGTPDLNTSLSSFSFFLYDVFGATPRNSGIICVTIIKL